MRYEARKDDAGLGYINLYWNDESGMTRRETIYSDMDNGEEFTEQLCNALNEAAKFLHNPPKEQIAA